MHSKTVLLLALLLLAGASRGQSTESLINGQWYFEMLHNDLGEVDFLMEFQATSDSTFYAHTRKDADKDILGGTKAGIARMFTKIFKGGSLARVINGKYNTRNDTIFFRGLFVNPMRNSHFDGFLVHQTFSVRLLDGKLRPVATLSGSKNTARLPLHDYEAVAEQCLSVAKDKIYNKAMTQSPSWKSFEKKLTKYAGKAQDDLEMVFGFFYFRRKISFSHFALLKIPHSRPDPEHKRKKRYTELIEKSPETALLAIRSLGGSKEEIDSIFNIISARHYKNLLIDLRGNTGGSVEAGFTLIQNLIQEPVYGGIFLTQKWFNAHAHIPLPTEYPGFEHFSEANFDAVIEGIHDKEGLCIVVKPNAQPFIGKVFVITDQATASTCEPIVYGLKQYKRAVIVGSNTAGAMLNGEKFALRDGYTLLLPTADFYTSDGQRLDKVGVKPDYEVKPDEALDFILKNLIHPQGP